MRQTLFGRAAQDGREQVEAVLRRVRSWDHRARRAGALSQGQEQRLEIGVLSAQDSKLLLVDEPVAGIAAPETATTAELLRETAADHAVVVVEHDMAFVRDLGVKVTVLAEGPLDHVSADPRVMVVYLGR